MAIEVTSPTVCPKCKVSYGRTNGKFQGLEIWVTCKCFPEQKMYLINTENVKIKKGAKSDK